MENAVDAIKIAGGVLLFVLALTVSISCFSQANRAVTAIVNMRDRDTEILYDQIRPNNDLTRIVGADTIVSTLKNAETENIEIYFRDNNNNPIPIYYKLTQNTTDEGEYIRAKDNDDITDIEISSIGVTDDDGNDQDSLLREYYNSCIDIILAGSQSDTIQGVEELLIKKFSQIHHESYPNGFYRFLIEHEFKEDLGEYYPTTPTDSSTTTTQIKKRVITYTLIR